MKYSIATFRIYLPIKFIHLKNIEKLQKKEFLEIHFSKS